MSYSPGIEKSNLPDGLLSIVKDMCSAILSFGFIGSPLSLEPEQTGSLIVSPTLLLTSIRYSHVGLEIGGLGIA